VEVRHFNLLANLTSDISIIHALKVFDEMDKDMHFLLRLADDPKK
jgi:hypothetical protein